jgi:hypothetical protein
VCIVYYDGNTFHEPCHGVGGGAGALLPNDLPTFIPISSGTSHSPRTPLTRIVYHTIPCIGSPPSLRGLRGELRAKKERSTIPRHALCKKKDVTVS